jgi:hypothetical protein
LTEQHVTSCPSPSGVNDQQLSHPPQPRQQPVNGSAAVPLVVAELLAGPPPGKESFRPQYGVRLGSQSHLPPPGYEQQHSRQQMQNGSGNNGGDTNNSPQR